ncbi:transcription elongation factor GreAB (plasmid) [Lactobacillus sp. PV037]|nr:transcription elongation factor GreAB [Lactobacillus sp. PV037]
MKLKVIKRGNSLALTLPKDSNFKLNETRLGIPQKEGKGLILVPKIENPYKDAKKGEFYIPEEWEDNESDVE